MSPSADQALLDGLGALRKALHKTGAPFMIIGGIAVIARGVPRQTIDVDATIWAADVDLDALVRTLGEYGISGRIPDFVQFAHDRQVLLLRHDPSCTPMELSLGWLPFEQEALERATTVDFGGIEIPVATAEDLVIYKAVAWRKRDLADIERLILLHKGDMNLERVRNLLSQFAQALEEPERLKEFDALVARALGGT